MVETYLEEELQNLVTNIEDLNEWKRHCEDLELQGQLKLASEDKSPVPFILMNKSMVRVYKTLCPETCKVNEFDKETIPLRVLSMLALCKEEKYFSVIEIWHNKKVPDPVAVGVKKEGWDNNYYLIARWGDELRSYAELKQMAFDIKNREVKSKAERILATSNHLVESYFNGEWVPGIE